MNQKGGVYRRARVGNQKVRQDFPYRFTNQEMALNGIKVLLQRVNNDWELIFSHFQFMDLLDINYYIGMWFAGLTRQHISVLMLRIFYNMSLGQSGIILDVSRERIRQIEFQALRILRHPERRKHITQLLTTDELREAG